MSPEQAWGDRVDRRSDLFSLGIVLYETLLGQGVYPYSAVSDIIQHARIASFLSPREIRPDFPEDLERIILKALDLDKNDRYQSALEFKIALDNCIAANKWRIGRDEWVQYLSHWIPFPNPPLPRMHAGEIAPDDTSILKPEVISAPITEDSDVTGQASSEMICELRRLAGYVSNPAVQTVSSPGLETLAPSISDTVAPAARETANEIATDAHNSRRTEHISRELASRTDTVQLPAVKASKISIFLIILIFVLLIVLIAALIALYLVTR
jgi:serine/threonine protein kinase